MLTKVCFDTNKQNNEKKKDARINKRLINQVSIKPKSHVTALAISKMPGHQDQPQSRIYEVDIVRGRKYLVTLVINWQLCTISFFAKFLTENNLPLTICEFPRRKQINNKVNKFNSYMTYGSFLINLFNGEVEYRLTPIFSKTKFMEVVSNQEHLNKFIQKQYEEAVKTAISSYSDQILEYIREEQPETKKNRPVLEILSIFQDNHRAVTKQFSEHIRQPQPQNAVKQGKTQLQNQEETNTSNKFLKIDNYYQCITHQTPQHQRLDEIQKIINDPATIQNIRSKMTILDQPKTCAADQANIISSIAFFSWIDLKDEMVFFQNTHSRLFRQKVKVQFCDGETRYDELFKNNTQYFDRILTLKMEKPPSKGTNQNSHIAADKSSRIQKQKKILEHLKQHRCLYIARYFTCVKVRGINMLPKQLNDGVLMEYYSYKSLDRFIETNKISLTPVTLLSCVSNMSFGLRFLRSVGCAHLDIKPSNALVGRYLHTRLSDFSQAYLSLDSQWMRNHKPWITLPYCPPEVFGNVEYDRYWDKMDVFSIGVIMLEVLLGFRIQQIRQNKIESFYRKKNYLDKIMLCPERTAHHMSGHVAHILIYIALRCLDPEPTSRPTIDWITYLLKSLYIFEFMG